MAESETEEGVSLKSLDKTRSDHYESKLEEFRKKSVNSENFDDYVQEVDGFIENLREIISDELDERTTSVKKKEELIKDEIGENHLSEVREQGPGRWNFDILQVSEIDRGLKDINWKLFELAWFLFQNTWVEKEKLKSVLQEMETQSIQSRYFEKHEEMIEKDREMLKKQFDNLVTGLKEIERNRTDSLEDLSESVEMLAERSIDTDSPETGSDEKDEVDTVKCVYCGSEFLNEENLEEHENDSCDMVKSEVKSIIRDKIEADEDFTASNLAEDHPRTQPTISSWVDEVEEELG